MLDSYNDANLSNPPHFVYADKLKRGRSFRLRLAGLCATIEKNQERTGVNGDR